MNPQATDPGSAPTGAPVPTSGSGRVHLNFLDGVRALAALYVLLFHCYTLAGGHGVAPLRKFLFLDYGHYSVGVFIVLSGFVLMLPVARSADGQLAGGVAGYLKRRARRILPPYYAALLFALILKALDTRLPPIFATKSPVTPGTVVSHLLLVHNLHPVWTIQLDSPMWSVGMEWQIYFVFALLLLPVWRRLGSLAAMITGLAVGYAPHFLAHTLDWTAPWYIGLFAFGMAAALVCFSNQPGYRKLREGHRWEIYAAVGIVFILGNLARTRGRLFWPDSAVDPILGAAVACLLIYLTRCAQEQRPSALLKLLAHPALVSLGRFSYSLYLVHILLLSRLIKLLFLKHVAPLPVFLLSVVVFAPLCIGASYLFHLVFERPFMRST